MDSCQDSGTESFEKDQDVPTLAFDTVARACLQDWVHTLEQVPHEDVDYDDTQDAITVRMPDGRVYVVHIHFTMQQIWVSSPVSGGRHFAWHEGVWMDTRNGQDLWDMWAQEWREAFGIAWPQSS